MYGKELREFYHSGSHYELLMEHGVPHDLVSKFTIENIANDKVCECMYESLCKFPECKEKYILLAYFHYILCIYTDDSSLPYYPYPAIVLKDHIQQQVDEYVQKFSLSYLQPWERIVLYQKLSHLDKITTQQVILIKVTHLLPNLTSFAYLGMRQKGKKLFAILPDYYIYHYYRHISTYYYCNILNSQASYAKLAEICQDKNVVKNLLINLRNSPDVHLAIIVKLVYIRHTEKRIVT